MQVCRKKEEVTEHHVVLGFFETEFGNFREKVILVYLVGEKKHITARTWYEPMCACIKLTSTQLQFEVGMYP